MNYYKLEFGSGIHNMQQVHSNMDFAKGDEIFKEIDEDDAAARDAEITRLIRSRRGYKSSFTRSANALTVLVESSQHNGLLDRSKSTQEAISRERERMEVRYEKLQTLNTRILRLNRDEDKEEEYEGQIDQTFEQYRKVTKAIKAHMIEALPHTLYLFVNFVADQLKHGHTKVHILAILKPDWP